jgi:hypothetical protein
VSAVAGHGYKNITANGTTVVKSGPGILHGITVNKLGSASTLQIFDNTAGSGTLIGTLNTAVAQASLIYDVAFSVGLCVVLAGTTAPDVTLSYL